MSDFSNRTATARLGAIAVLVGLLACGAPALAQGVDAEGAREKIIDAPVETGHVPVGSEDDRIAAAIGRSAASAQEIRKKFNIGKVEIVFVDGLADEQSPLARTIAERADDIAQLRREIDGSAIFFHAVDSQQILVRDVVAVEFGENDDVTIFVIAPSAS